MKFNIKKYLSVTIILTLLVSLLVCAPASAASHTTPFMYCDFNDEEANDFFAAGRNGVTDSIVEGAAGSDGAFQRSYNLNTYYDTYLIPARNSFDPALFSGKIRVSFWFKIDPTVGTLLTTGSAPLNELHPRFYVTSGAGANKELQHATYTKKGWDTAALNRGEWVFIEMISNANGKFASYTLQSTDTIALQIRLSTVGNTANRGWTDTNCISYTIDDFKIEKVIDSYDDTEAYKYPWAEELAVTGKTIEDNTVTLSYNYENNDPTKTEGISHIRVLRETAAGSNKFAVIEEFTGNASGNYTYTITSEWIGKKLKMEVIPVDCDGTYGASYTKIVGPIAKAFEVDLTIGDFTPILDSETDTYTYSITGTSSIINNKADGSTLYAVLIVVLKDAENEIINWLPQAVTVSNTSSTAATAIPTVKKCMVTATAEEYAKTVKAECYLWDCGENDAPTVFNTTMEELAATQVQTK